MLPEMALLAVLGGVESVSRVYVGVVGVLLGDSASQPSHPFVIIAELLWGATCCHMSSAQSSWTLQLRSREVVSMQL